MRRNSNAGSAPPALDYPSLLAEASSQRQERTERFAQLWTDLRAIGAERLAADLERLVWDAAVDEQDQVMRRLGADLVELGEERVWQLVYGHFNDGSAYAIGDELDFLYDRPRRSTRAVQ